MAKANKKKNNKSAKPAVQNQKAEVLTEEQVLQNQTEDAQQNVEAAEEAKTAVAQQPKKEEKADKNEKPKKNKPAKQSNPKPNKVKETVAELKKVTWPTFPQVVKNTLLVLVIVLISTIVLFGIEYGLSWLYKLLTPAA